MGSGSQGQGAVSGEVPKISGQIKKPLFLTASNRTSDGPVLSLNNYAYGMAQPVGLEIRENAK